RPRDRGMEGVSFYLPCAGAAEPRPPGPRPAGRHLGAVPRMGVQQGPGHEVPVVEVVQPSLRDRDGLGRLEPLPGQVYRRRVLRVEEEDSRVVKFAHGTGATRQDGRTVPQRVEDRKAEPFVPRRVDRPTGLLVEAAKPG